MSRRMEYSAGLLSLLCIICGISGVSSTTRTYTFKLMTGEGTHVSNDGGLNDCMFYRLRGSSGSWSEWSYVCDMPVENTMYEWTDDLTDVGEPTDVIIQVNRNLDEPRLYFNGFGVDSIFLDMPNIKIATFYNPDIRTYLSCTMVQVDLTGMVYRNFDNEECAVPLELYTVTVVAGNRDWNADDVIYVSVSGIGSTSFAIIPSLLSGETYTNTFVLENVGPALSMELVTKNKAPNSVASAGVDGEMVAIGENWFRYWQEFTQGSGCGYIFVDFALNDYTYLKYSKDCPVGGGALPSLAPTEAPVSPPTSSPSTEPTMSPLDATASPSAGPSEGPSAGPSEEPSMAPTVSPFRTYRIFYRLPGITWWAHASTLGTVYFKIIGEFGESSWVAYDGGMTDFATGGAEIDLDFDDVGTAQSLIILTMQSDELILVRAGVDGSIRSFWGDNRIELRYDYGADSGDYGIGCSYMVVELGCCVTDFSKYYNLRNSVCPYRFELPTPQPAAGPAYDGNCGGADYESLIYEIQASGGGSVFIPVVVIEAEDMYTDAVDFSITTSVSWQGEERPDYGGDYILSIPFQINDADVGQYRLVMRSRASETSDDFNDIYVRFLDADYYAGTAGGDLYCPSDFGGGSTLPCNEGYTPLGRYQGWIVAETAKTFSEGWSFSTVTDAGAGGLVEILVDFPVGGTYTIEFSAKSPGFQLGKFILVRTADEPLIKFWRLNQLSASRCDDPPAPPSASPSFSPSLRPTESPVVTLTDAPSAPSDAPTEAVITPSPTIDDSTPAPSAATRRYVLTLSTFNSGAAAAKNAVVYMRVEGEYGVSEWIVFDEFFGRSGWTWNLGRWVTNVGDPRKLVLVSRSTDSLIITKLGVDWNIVTFDQEINLKFNFADIPSAGCSYVEIDITTMTYKDVSQDWVARPELSCPYVVGGAFPTQQVTPGPIGSWSECDGAPYQPQYIDLFAGGDPFFVIMMEFEDFWGTSDLWKYESNIQGYKGTGFMRWDSADIFDFNLGKNVDVLRAYFYIPEGEEGRYTFMMRSIEGPDTTHVDQSNDVYWKMGDNVKDFYAWNAQAENIDGLQVVCPDERNNNELPCRGPDGERKSYLKWEGWYKVFKNQCGCWDWSTTVEATHGNFFVPVFEVDAPGVYEIQIAGRSQDFTVDRVAIIKYGDHNRVMNWDLDNMPTTPCGPV